MSKTTIQRLGEVPLLGFLIMVFAPPLSLAELALALAWLLRVLEIGSVFDRWLPGFSSWELLSGVVIVGGALWAMERLLEAMKTV